MANFHQVFGDGPISEHARSYCEYEGEVEPVCGLVEHGYLFCYKCDRFTPKMPTENSKTANSMSSH